MNLLRMEKINVQRSFSDYINDAIRILILLDAVKERKSVKMTDSKIMLYDYYLKFPCTMLGDDIDKNTFNIQWNFDESYAFFHGQPDLVRYRQSLNYLISKGLIKKETENNYSIYKISESGTDALNSINNPYKSKLVDLTVKFIPQIIKLSDLKIRQIINEKTKK